ncbi:MAG: hypothetical protein JNL38_26765 [Myxococcales bacterium]|nr:hypothetical protein [Myxococcales bacterium]
MRTWWVVSMVVAAGVLGACSGEVGPSGGEDSPASQGPSSNDGASSGTSSSGSNAPGETAPPEPTLDDIFKSLKSGEEQRKELCARGGTNRVTQMMCGASAPKIESLADLQGALGLAFQSPNSTGRNANGQNGNPGFVLSGHSSSLVARYTSAINPRAIVFSPQGGANLVAMGFVRGEQFAEIVARDSSQNGLRFFLVAFKQACNAAPGGCTPGELLTPAIEKGWTSVTIYEDTDVKNTIFDCTHCHQTAGTNTPKMLRFQELQNPWTHFFRDNTPGGQALLADYHAAHGRAEGYGPIPANQIDSSDPARLESFVRGAGFAAQPNEFLTSRIEQEVRQSAPSQPGNNTTPGTSPTWQGLYSKFVAGAAIAPPYHDVKVTDPTKLAAMTSAYQQFLGGSLEASKLPDIRDVLLGAAAVDMGLAAKPGLDGKGLLVQMCQSCHNPNLDQTISRARFDVTKLATMSREEKEVAISRLRLASTNPAKMPPSRFRTLTDAEIGLVEAELRR